MLALFLACSISAGGLSAQTAYNFGPTALDIPAVTGSGQNILTMDCFAANGYGQWTSSSNTTNSIGYKACFLLSNQLNSKPGSGSWDDAMAGVLGVKQFTYNNSDVYPYPTDVYPTEAIKCVANLKGNVRYVWIDNTSARDQFYVEGFDPATSTNASTGIGIDFVGLGSGSSSAAILKNSTTATYYTEGVISSGTLVSSTNEALYPDMFDVAIDANYLYIVWEEYSSPTYSIYGAAVNLSTNAVTQLGLVAYGRRPTVSIDVRNSGSIGNIDVAYLLTVPGNVNWTEYNESTTLWSSPVSVTTTMSGYGWNWSNATHARIVDASAPGSSSTDKAIYFIASDNNSTPALFLNRIVAGSLSASCNYCDGYYNTTRPANSPIVTSSGYAVMDDYIRAFINPYDGNTSSGSFNHFNCLYVLNYSGGPTHGLTPVMIIQGSNPDSAYCVSGGTTLGSFPYDDPVAKTMHKPYQYVGGANQMGIYVHWTGLNTGDHYVQTDAHSIDQYIEENTLLTAKCTVDNNVNLTSNWLTLYSDPGSAGITGYSGSGILNINNGKKLDIPSGGYGDFVLIGASTINFDNTAGDIIEVDANDQMDFYGSANSSIVGTGEFKFVGSGDYVATGSYGSYVWTISAPATLNLHPGTSLIVGTSYSNPNYFTCTDAEIHANTGTNVITGSGTTWGNLTLNGHSSFTQSIIESDYTGDITSSNPIITIQSNGSAGSAWPSWTNGTGNADYNGTYSSLTFAIDTFEKCLFTTGSNTGHAYIQILGKNIAPNGLIVDQGYVEGISFISPPTGSSWINPYWPITFTGVTFGRIVQYGMDISFLYPPSQAEYTEYSLLVNGCGFQGFDPLSSPNPDGIKVESAADLIAIPGSTPTAAEDALREDITIENNTFEPTIYFPYNGMETDETDGSIEAAIHFSDATGDIISNNISGEKYERGIWNESSTSASHDDTWTFMCTNNISSLAYAGAAGISTDWYTGYIKSDTIFYCTTGQLSGYNDAGHIDFSGYAYNYGPAYTGVNGSQTDIAGVHHPSDPSIDDPAYNIFENNNSGGIQITLDQSNYPTYPYSLVYLGQAGPYSGSWAVFGDNDIEGSTDVASTLSGTPIVDVGNNYWGGSPGVAFSGTNVTYTDHAGDLSSQDISRDFTCTSDDDDASKRKGAKTPLILAADTAMSHCDSLLTNGYGLLIDGFWQDSYDTLRLFMEECPFYVGGKYNAGVASYEGFNYVSNAVTQWQAGGVERWSDFLAWLKQVLYLNPDTTWYCSDVGDMITAFQNNEAEQESAIQYVVNSGKCPGFASLLSAPSYWRHQFWLDSILVKYDTVQPWGKYGWWVDSLVNQDTLANPYDSTIPSLQQENLQILMGQQFAGIQPSSPITSQGLLSAQLLENPIKDEIDVSYQMGRTALVTMELRDVLGRSVPIANAKYQLEQPGSHQASIPAPNLPPGTYYLRITTDAGDAITLKVMKE